MVPQKRISMLVRRTKELNEAWGSIIGRGIPLDGPHIQLSKMMKQLNTLKRSPLKNIRETVFILEMIPLLPWMLLSGRLSCVHNSPANRAPLI